MVIYQHLNAHAMSFGIYVFPSEEHDLLEITEEEFARLRSAKQNLIVVQSIEEKLAILLENYAEFETTLLAETVQNVVFQVTGRSAAIELIYTLNRRIVNLLTACRLYIDHIKHDLKAIYGDGSAVGTRVTEAAARQYDERLGYRVIEALRNYVQHRGLPVDSVQHLMSAAKGAAPGFIANIATPSLNTRRIKEDGGFKSAVLGELIAIGEKIDIKPLIRDYIEGVCEIHKVFRQTVLTDVLEWEATLKSAMECRRSPDGKLPALFVVQLDHAGDTIEEVQVFEDILTRRQELERRIPLYGNLSKQIVTSEAKDIRQNAGSRND